MKLKSGCGDTWTSSWGLEDQSQEDQELISSFHLCKEFEATRLVWNPVLIPLLTYQGKKTSERQVPTGSRKSSLKYIGITLSGEMRLMSPNILKNRVEEWIPSTEGKSWWSKQTNFKSYRWINPETLTFSMVNIITGLCILYICEKGV